MLKITELEHQKLVSLAYDEVGMEALKKFFLESFLDDKIDYKIDALAASRLAITFLKDGFKELAQLKDLENGQSSERKNVV